MRGLFFLLLGMGLVIISAQAPSQKEAIQRGITSGLAHIKDSIWSVVPPKDTLLNANTKKILPAIKKTVEENKELKYENEQLKARLKFMEEMAMAHPQMFNKTGQ
jgi:hypothetical protein